MAGGGEEHLPGGGSGEHLDLLCGVQQPVTVLVEFRELLAEEAAACLRQLNDLHSQGPSNTSSKSQTFASSGSLVSHEADEFAAMHALP